MSEKKWIKKACSIDAGRILVFGILIVLLSGSAASAADTGWVVPSSNVGGSGVTNPQNAYASDTAYARFAANGNYWNWYGYVLSSIPAGSTIDGIEVNARGLRQSGCGSNCLMQVRLSYDSGTSWTSYINTATWSTTNTDHILGGPTNTWGRTWTRDEIANSFRAQALWQVTGTYYGDLDYLPVRVYYTAGAASTYNISGYITNTSSGLPLNGATVQTNTTLSTTTNAQGYYIFTGLSNGTYNISATQSNYNSNYTIKSINGANITNANISLSPIPPAPTYLLSGHVTNQSNGAAISGATVTTNTTLTTSTDGTGYYAFTVSNGNYLITASKTGYTSNSITRTVNGAAVNNADISLMPTPSSGAGQIIVATNRFVVLDDPLTTGKTAQTAAGFALPSGTGWSLNAWSSAQTTIKGYALVLDDNGNPITNTPVIFTIRNWDSLDKTTSTAINTDANGIANYSLDLNAKNYYGNWYVDANATALGKSSSTGFIYNWFGCNSGGC
ncbi:MAG: carboxypeptidase regulatory-like domain-containing protein, partial [Nitrospira sp.]|nr:carboxypeptidase regulatory-like domain-containing protein [Nitrospira sp.]